MFLVILSLYCFQQSKQINFTKLPKYSINQSEYFAVFSISCPITLKKSSSGLKPAEGLYKNLQNIYQVLT
jgi:hypothetical protein